MPRCVTDDQKEPLGWVGNKESDMKNALDTIKTWAWGFIDLMLIFIAVGVLVQVIFGGDTTTFFDGMVANLMGLVAQLGNGGFVGLIALVIIIALFNRRTA